MTLTEFLLARITEDEHSRLHEGAAQHAKQRAECESKRLIVGFHTPWDLGSCYGCGGVGGRHSYATCPNLRALALPYADHPDYLSEWRP